MHVTAVIQGIGSIGFFSSRAFLPAFVTVLLLRFGPEIPLLADCNIIQEIHGAPTWFTHSLTITLLGLLSAIELMATKSPEARQLLNEFDNYLKSGMSALTYLGVMSTADAEFVDGAVQQAGLIESTLTVVIAAGVFFASTIRGYILETVFEADEDDDLGIQGLMSWGEDLWVVTGLVFLVLFPIVMLLLIGIATGLLVLARKYAEHREETSKVPCIKCNEMIYPSAVACPTCKTKAKAPCKIGFLGQSKLEPVTDLIAHRFSLVENKRCPVCATRFKRRAAQQPCTACGHKLMGNEQFAQKYVEHIHERVPQVFLVTFLLSLIPVIGLIPGVIYYRMALVAPFRRYIPLGQAILLKWLLRFMFFVSIAFQWVPLLGGLVVPMNAMLSYWLYRTSYRRLVIRRGPGSNQDQSPKATAE